MRLAFWRKPEPQPRYCTACGSPLVNGYLVIGTRYDPQTAEKQVERAYGLVCKVIYGMRRHGNLGYARHHGFDDVWLHGRRAWEPAA